MRSPRLFTLVLALASAIGCGDDIKFPDPPELPDPALNGVNPPSGFKSRTIRVQVSGDVTELTSAATVSFGAGITVDETVVASPSLIVATITIAGDAAIGPRDVVVTDGDATHMLAAAFEVKSPIEVFPVSPAVQGGFTQVILVNRDTEHPWLGFLDVTAGPGTNFDVPQIADPPELLDNYVAVATVFLDVDATSGFVTVTDTLLDSVSSTGDELPVTARTPVALQPVGKGTGLEATATMSGGTNLFSFTTSGLVMADVFPQGKSNDLPFMAFLLDGKWTDIRNVFFETFDEFGGNDPVPVIGSGFVVVFDAFETFLGDQVVPYDFRLFVDDEFFPLPGVTQINEAEPNDTTATAQTAGAIHLVNNAAIDNDFGDDVFKVAVTAGQRVRVQTTTGPSLFTDTVIQLLIEDPANAGQFIEIGDSGDDVLAEGVTATSPTAGDVFVVVSDGFDGFAGDEYEIAIDILPALE